MELDAIDKLIIEIGILKDEYERRISTLRSIKESGGIQRHDIDMLTLMAESFRLDGIGLRDNITKCTTEFMANYRRGSLGR